MSFPSASITALVDRTNVRISNIMSYLRPSLPLSRLRLIQANQTTCDVEIWVKGRLSLHPGPTNGEESALLVSIAGLRISALGPYLAVHPELGPIWTGSPFEREETGSGIRHLMLLVPFGMISSNWNFEGFISSSVYFFLSIED